MLAMALIAAMPLAKTRAATPPSSDARFSSSRVTRGIRNSRILVPLVLADPLLHIGRTQINGNVDSACQRIRLLPIVNRARRKPSLSIFRHDYFLRFIGFSAISADFPSVLCE